MEWKTCDSVPYYTVAGWGSGWRGYLRTSQSYGGCVRCFPLWMTAWLILFFHPSLLHSPECGPGLSRLSLPAYWISSCPFNHCIENNRSHQCHKMSLTLSFTYKRTLVSSAWGNNFTLSRAEDTNTVLVLVLVSFLGLRDFALTSKPANIQIGLSRTKVPNANLTIRGHYLKCNADGRKNL